MPDSQSQSSADNPDGNVNPGAQASDEAHNPNRYCSQVEDSGTPKGKKKQTDACIYKPDQTPLWKDGLAVATLLVGAFVAYIYWNQRAIMNKQLCQMVKQYPELQKSAEAAKEAADVATQQMILQERPWINLIPGEGVPDSGSVPDKAAIGVQFTISNPGKTAAIDLKWETFNILVRPGQFVEPHYVPMDPTWTTKMYPGSSSTPNVTLRGSMIHSAAKNKAWQARKLWEELAIRISYRDNIDVKHAVHVTESCIFVIWSNAANPQCPSHNYQN